MGVFELVARTQPGRKSVKPESLGRLESLGHEGHWLAFEHHSRLARLGVAEQFPLRPDRLPIGPEEFRSSRPEYPATDR